MKKRGISFLMILCSLALSSCFYFANKPLRTLEYKTNTTAPNENLFVFMRGLGGSNRSFEDAGMVEEIIKRNIPFDVIAPNAHFAYYSERTLIERLHEDVILPASRQGYKNIWLVGVSMGGLGSMLYLKEKPEYIDGVFIVVPFLGYDEILDEIISSGGVNQWLPGEYDPVDDWERMFWHWIKDDVSGKNTIPIYLGYGKSDEYVKGQQLFSTVIPEKKILAIDGGHDIATITSLWNIFLERGLYTTEP